MVGFEINVFFYFLYLTSTRSSFLDSEVRSSLWVYYYRSEQVIRILFWCFHTPPTWRYGGRKRESRDGVCLAFDKEGPGKKKGVLVVTYLMNRMNRSLELRSHLFGVLRIMIGNFLSSVGLFNLLFMFYGWLVHHAWSFRGKLSCGYIYRGRSDGLLKFSGLGTRLAIQDSPYFSLKLCKKGCSGRRNLFVGLRSSP